MGQFKFGGRSYMREHPRARIKLVLRVGSTLPLLMDSIIASCQNATEIIAREKNVGGETMGKVLGAVPKRGKAGSTSVI